MSVTADAHLDMTPVNEHISCLYSQEHEESAVQVRGDVFLARVFDNGDDFKRLDFALSEVSSTAAWVKEAYAQNERKRKVQFLTLQPSR